MSKLIFITGGVVSSIGKGIAIASLAATVEARGYKVTLLKLDPYINVDPGTMSPYQHGEVFVTKDGAETDLDLGHYERFINADMSSSNTFTTGKIYDTVIKKERLGEFEGGTVQVIPHITDEIKSRIYKLSKGYDCLFIEIGGTVGDIESLPFIEAVRQIKLEKPKDVICIHVTWVPYLKAAGEIKTKPTQHSVKELRNVGLIPDILVCRCEKALNKNILKKISILTSVPSDSVFYMEDVNNIYKVPLLLNKKKLDEVLLKKLNLEDREANFDKWIELTEQLKKLKQKLKIAIIGKYSELTDSYKSLIEGLKHSCYQQSIDPQIDVIGSDDEEFDVNALKDYNTIIIPGGFGERGIDNKIKTIQFARENNIAFLGICMGMQLAVIEYARNVIGLTKANSGEFIKTEDGQKKEKFDNVIDILDGWTNLKGDKISDRKQNKKIGGTMRLGEQNIHIKNNTLASTIYGKKSIKERHRHRYEVNPSYISSIEKQGFKFSGYSDDKFPEIIEIDPALHKCFIAVQFHPEFNSKPALTNPLFDYLITQSNK